MLILIGFASGYIEMYIKPNTTAEVVCPYKEIKKEPIIWWKSNKIIGFRNTVGVFQMRLYHGYLYIYTCLHHEH
jgi:hypothetical protein